MTRSHHQASSNARDTPRLDCLGRPITIDEDVQAKERARIAGMIHGYRSNIGIAAWAKWMTNETEEDLKRKAVKQKLIIKIAKAAFRLKQRSADVSITERARNNAARKLAAAQAMDRSDTLQFAKVLGVSVNATEKRLLK